MTLAAVLWLLAEVLVFVGMMAIRFYLKQRKKRKINGKAV